MQAPVFVVGSPRSGTTLFQFLLRQNSAFLCPHETHFFRWNEPYGSTDYLRFLQENETLIKHRELDGVSEEVFSRLLSRCSSKKELFCGYIDLLLERQNHAGANIVFDKTPQHVYSLTQIRIDFPDMRVIHVVRNPLNVVSSLMLGRDFSAQNLVGALNYWLEAVALVDDYSRMSTGGSRLLEVRYEDLVTAPEQELAKVCQFVETEEKFAFDFSMVHPEQNLYLDVLDERQIEIVRARTRLFTDKYGYT